MPNADKIYIARLMDNVVIYSERSVVFRDEHGYFLNNGRYASKLNKAIETDLDVVYVQSLDMDDCERIMTDYITGKIVDYGRALQTVRRG